MGRDAITLFGANEAAGDSATSTTSNGDGVFEAVETVVTAARAASIADYEFADDLHQPYVDEFILGLRTPVPRAAERGHRRHLPQLPGQCGRASTSTASTRAGPNQPFGGFGAVDPNRGIIFQQQNNSWSTLEYRALEMTVAKNMSHNFQADGRHQPAVAALRRHLEPDRSGEVHPAGHLRRATRCSTCRAATTRRTACRSRPARPCTPTGRPGRSTRCASAAPTWRRGGSTLAASYTILAGPWSGPIVDQLAASDPQLAVFGPASVRARQRHDAEQPAVDARCASSFPTRGEGQVQAPAIKTLGLTLQQDH